MEQRNELLQKMRMTERQKRGDVQHLLARSFSTRQMSTPQGHFATPLSPPGEISIPVPQLPRVHFDHPPHSAPAPVALADVTLESHIAGGNSFPLMPITEELGVETGQPVHVIYSGERVNLWFTCNFCALQSHWHQCHRHGNVETAPAARAVCLRRSNQYENHYWKHRFPARAPLVCPPPPPLSLIVCTWCI